MQITMELNGKCCWASRLRDLLCKFGFVWLQKSVGNERAFLAILKERLCDDFNQEWNTAINSSEKFCLYASFKSNLLAENYLDFVQIKCFRDVLIKLRMGVLPLNANRFRYAHENACYTRNFIRDTSTSTCKLNILLRSWCSVMRKAQVKTLHFLYFMPVKKMK